MPLGVVFALAAYAAYAFGDAIIKSFGTDLTAFEIAFWITLFSTLPVYFTRPRSERISEVFKTRYPIHLNVRAAISFLSALCIIYAFTHIPLAETYALAFLMPSLITILAVLFLKEDMTLRRWFALALGFAGVLLVVRPGFRELQLGHLAAIGAALLASVAAVQLRLISQTEKRITIVGYSVAYSLVLNGIIIFAFKGLTLPSTTQLLTLACVGLLGGAGHVLIINAAKNAHATWVAQAQYSQIIWAIVLGALFYQEYPGPFTIAGLAIVALAGLMNFTPERARTWFGAHALTLRRTKSPQAATVPETEKESV